MIPAALTIWPGRCPSRPLLVEAYVGAAQKISRLAMGEAVTPSLFVYRAPEDSSQDYHVEGLPFGTRGGVLLNYIFPSEGEYSVTITPIFGDNMSPTGFGSVECEKVEVLLDGERIQLIDWQGGRGGGGGGNCGGGGARGGGRGGVGGAPGAAAAEGVGGQGRGNRGGPGTGAAATGGVGGAAGVATADRASVARAEGIVVAPVRVRHRQAVRVAAQELLQADRAAAIAAALLL